MTRVEGSWRQGKSEVVVLTLPPHPVSGKGHAREVVVSIAAALGVKHHVAVLAAVNGWPPDPVLAPDDVDTKRSGGSEGEAVRRGCVPDRIAGEIGRASCRARVCQYV